MSPPAVTNLSQPPSSGGSVKQLSRGESILERYQHSHENFVLGGICCYLQGFLQWVATPIVETFAHCLRLYKRFMDDLFGHVDRLNPRII
jgi:hypothetical protein